MLKTIFFSIDGIGLGHIRRGINIANELRKIAPGKIIFATNSSFSGFFEENGFDYLVGGADPVEWCNHKISYEEYLRINERFLMRTIEDFCPGIVIFDFMVMPNVIRSLKHNNIFSVYILRDINTFDFFTPLRQEISLFDLVLLAGARDDGFKDHAIDAGFDKDKIHYVGNIFRRPDKKLVPFIKKKYKKMTGELLFTITIGGGGGGKVALREIKKFVLNVFLVSRKIEHSKKIRWLFIKGPLFPDPIPTPKWIEGYDYEGNLTELFSISDLVIATGGYNTVNEIIASKCPAVIYPLAHKEEFAESQGRRANAYASNGFIKVLEGNSPQDLIGLFRDALRPGVLDRMKRAYSGFSHPNGSRSAARLIIENFSRFKKRLGS